MSDRYVIWSHEHGAWWGPDRCGYVQDARDAGRYSEAEAGAIVVSVIPSGSEVAVHEFVAMRHGTAHIWGMAAAPQQEAGT